MSNKFPLSNFHFSKIAKTFLTVSAVGLVAVSCNQQPEIRNQQSAIQRPQQIWVSQRVEGLENPTDDFLINEGTNALDLLKISYQVETKTFSGIGEYVTSINGRKENTGKNFWAFYVNGQQSQVGASAYKPKNGDKIEWRLEEIKN